MNTGNTVYKVADTQPFHSSGDIEWRPHTVPTSALWQALNAHMHTHLR